MIEEYFLDFFFSKFFNKSWKKVLNWINLKFRGLKQTKIKLKDLNQPLFPLFNCCWANGQKEEF